MKTSSTDKVANERQRPKQSQPIASIIKQSIRDIIPSLRLMFPFILLIVAAKDVVMMFGGLPADRVMAYFIALIVTCIQVYCWSACLLSVDARIRGQRFGLSDVCQKTLNRAPNFLATFFLMILILVGVFYLGFVLTHALKQTGMTAGIFQILYIGLPIFVLIVLMIFAVPLAVLEKKSLLSNFLTSAKIIAVRNFARVLVLYAFIAFCVLLLMPGTVHSHYLIAHHLIVPFDIVVLSVLAPFLVNFTVLLLNDLRS